MFEKDWYAANVPGITEEAMEYFRRKVKAIGSDAASTDAAYTESKIEQYAWPGEIVFAQ